MPDQGQGLLRIWSFLDEWGIINFQARVGNFQDPRLTGRVCVAAQAQSCLCICTRASLR